jgi:hypothetical protein
MGMILLYIVGIMIMQYVAWRTLVLVIRRIKYGVWFVK